MKDSSNNIQFNYLHRDDGNYKLFGSMVFSNVNNLTLEEIEKATREKLIDGEFFYPKEWNIDFLEGSHKSIYFIGWYEFEGVSFKNEGKSEIIDISELLFKVKVLKSGNY